jgi:hypothetical protein
VSETNVMRVGVTSATTPSIVRPEATSVVVHTSPNWASFVGIYIYLNNGAFFTRTTNPPMAAPQERALTPPSPPMPAPLDPLKYSQALQDLGVTPDAIKTIRTAPYDKAKILVEEIKVIAKSRYRQLVHQLHPDKTGGDAEKTARFTFLTLVFKQVQQMEPPPPPFPQQVVVINFSSPPSAQAPRPRHVQVNFRAPISPTSGPPRVRPPNGVRVVNMKPT